MNKRNTILIIITAFLLITLAACAEEPKIDTRTFDSGKLTITFDYEKISGRATNQFAVWVEDMDGHYINTLYATRWTANGGYKSRPDSIALWVEKSDIASMQKAEVDAIKIYEYLYFGLPAVVTGIPHMRYYPYVEVVDNSPEQFYNSIERLYNKRMNNEIDYSVCYSSGGN